MAAAAFASEGYAVLPGLISADHCDTLISLLADLADLAEGAGSRDLLERDGCRKLAQMLSEHTALAGLLPPAIAPSNAPSSTSLPTGTGSWPCIRT